MLAAGQFGVVRYQPDRATPVTAKLYTECGLPWFDLYDEAKGDEVASETLKKVKAVKEMDQEKGFTPQQDDGTIEIPDSQVKKLGEDTHRTLDGQW